MFFRIFCKRVDTRKFLHYIPRMSKHASQHVAKSRQSADDKGIALGKEAICRAAKTINSQQLTRLLEEKKDTPLMRLIHVDPDTGNVWAYKADLEKYRETHPLAIDAARKRRRRNRRAVLARESK